MFGWFVLVDFMRNESYHKNIEVIIFSTWYDGYVAWIKNEMKWIIQRVIEITHNKLNNYGIKYEF